jgi:hypothetical protein
MLWCENIEEEGDFTSRKGYDVVVGDLGERGGFCDQNV